MHCRAENNPTFQSDSVKGLGFLSIDSSMDSVCVRVCAHSA